MLALIAASVFTAEVAWVVDGDTFVTKDGVHVRLAAVDSPEIHGCRGRKGRICTPGDGAGAKRALEGLVLGRTVRCERVGTSYRRTVAFCSGRGADISCQLIRGGWARYVPEYDRRGRLRGC